MHGSINNIVMQMLFIRMITYYIIYKIYTIFKNIYDKHLPEMHTLNYTNICSMYFVSSVHR